MGFREDDKAFVVESQEEVLFFGNLCDRELYELPLEEFLDMVKLDYTAFSEVDKMQGYLMSGLPENPVLPSED